MHSHLSWIAIYIAILECFYPYLQYAPKQIWMPLNCLEIMLFNKNVFEIFFQAILSSAFVEQVMIIIVCLYIFAYCFAHMCGMCCDYLRVCVGYICSSHTCRLLVKGLGPFDLCEEHLLPTPDPCDQKLPKGCYKIVSTDSPVRNNLVT